MDDDEPPSTSTSSESPEVVKPPKTSSRKRRATRRAPPADHEMEQDEGVEKESQSQYAKGFFDALRVVQGSSKFDFNEKSSPVYPNITSSSFSPITPATASDMRTIVMSFLGNTPLTTACGSTIPTLSSPILPMIADGQIDELSMKLLASSALPGPPIQLSSSNSPDSSSSVTQIALPPLLSNLVSSTTASTSRPDKLNFSPPRAQFDRSSYNLNSDDSDGGFAESRSASRGGGRGGVDEMGMGDQEKKKLERKRARNRQAASKCRQKKMDRIKELEDQVTNEKHRGQRLDAELVELQRALDNFRRVVERHAQVGCSTQSIRA